MNDRHPCFNREAHGRFGRIHLPVAARCNIVCGFCDRRYACVNESRPGVTAVLLSPEEACELTVRAAARLAAKEIADIGVRHMTITVNAVDPAIGERIYRRVQGPDGPLSGEEGASLLLERQEAGIRRLKALGLTIKVNTVVVPEINDFHVAAIAERVADWGASLINCLSPYRGRLSESIPNRDTSV